MNLQPLTDDELPALPDWTPCMKLPVVVHVRDQRPCEQHVSTREGLTPVKPDDLIMRGVSGEEYPIGREIFKRTYTLDVGDAERQSLKSEQELAKVPAVARLCHWKGDPPREQTVARTYEECPENLYPDSWEEGPKLYPLPPNAAARIAELEAALRLCKLNAGQPEAVYQITCAALETKHEQG